MFHRHDDISMSIRYVDRLQSMGRLVYFPSSRGSPLESPSVNTQLDPLLGRAARRNFGPPAGGGGARELRSSYGKQHGTQESSKVLELVLVASLLLVNPGAPSSVLVTSSPSVSRDTGKTEPKGSSK